jgi:hypothetical protein
MWESMSLPCFRKPYSFIWIGFFVLGMLQRKLRLL